MNAKVAGLSKNASCLFAQERGTICRSTPSCYFEARGQKIYPVCDTRLLGAGKAMFGKQVVPVLHLLYLISFANGALQEWHARWLLHWTFSFSSINCFIIWLAASAEFSNLLWCPHEGEVAHKAVRMVHFAEQLKQLLGHAATSFAWLPRVFCQQICSPSWHFEDCLYCTIMFCLQVWLCGR
jgi:hypothetical protein